MLISQTYLGNPDPNSKVFLYYFWKDSAQQKRIHPQVYKGLSYIDHDLRDEGSALVPEEGKLDVIRDEMRDVFKEFWHNFGNLTPGIFLYPKPLSNFDPQKDIGIFIEINDKLLRDKYMTEAFFFGLNDFCRVIIDNQSENEGKFDLKGLIKTITKFKHPQLEAIECKDGFKLLIPHILL